jgi:hypothetical protein
MLPWLRIPLSGQSLFGQKASWILSITYLHLDRFVMKISVANIKKYVN